ncbi:hypothetical protein Tco_0946203 [Tanacetum coccineum]
MDNLNITIEEYIRLQEEKALRHGRTFNWQTTTYSKVKYCEDEDDCFTNFETEYPAIVFDDTLTYNAALSFEPTVSPLNENEIDFRISFDESDNEDYTVIFDKNSFCYKTISVDNLKTDSENDNDKVDIPSFPSPEPTVSYFNDLDYFKDFDKEFPAIVYNDALTSKLDSLTKPAVGPHHIDELDLKNDTSLSKYDEEEQSVIYFNDLFPLNIIYPDDQNSDKDNDDDEINIIQFSGGNHNMGKTIGELHALLIEYEKGLPKKAATPQVIAIQDGRIHKANKKSLNAKGKGKGKGKRKDKPVYILKPKNPKPSAERAPDKG